MIKQHANIPWGPIRSVLIDKFSFSEIKNIVGHGNIDMPQLAHLEQSPKNGATKSQLLSAIDKQFNILDIKEKNKFISICCEEMSRKNESIIEELERTLSRVGWKFAGTSLIPIDIFDADELLHISEAAHADIIKAASRLRDGDLSGALSASCGAIDALTRDIYEQYNIGNVEQASFQEKVKKSLEALKIKENLTNELENIGWLETEYKPLLSNMEGSFNQAAYVMQKLRSKMGDVHGTKPVINALVYDSIKWSSLLLRMLSNK